jgi:PKD repeat protein
MKKSSLLLLFFTISFLGFAQTSENWCGTDHYHAERVAENPALETLLQEQIYRAANSPVATDRDGEIVIPVVVHILHDNGEGNISNEQVLSGIEMLNEDFCRLNADTVDTRDETDAPFEGIASTMGIRFELAKLDPDGNCTNGIERRYVGSQSYNCDNAAKHYATGGLDAWNRNYYFNIWIVNSIDSDGGGTTLGYAEFPYGGGSSNYGVIIRNDSYGKTGTASGDRTLTHEVGHCLGLLHTFQGGCHWGSCNENGDYCCDTPPVSEAQWSCVPTQNTCDEIPGDDPYGFDALDQFENFMSYSPCQNMFSEDQKNIVLNNLENIGFLENLVDPDNHDINGVGLPEVLCEAQFRSDHPTAICTGTSLAFYDDSYANVTSWNWTFEGGSPSSSTDENPIVTYDTPGVYAVTLEVSDGVSTVSTMSEGYVVVLQSDGMTLPYSEGFESISDIPDNERFLILDEDEEDAWELTDLAAYSGEHCVYIPNRGNDNRTYDELISGTFDLSGIDEDDDMIFNFKYAYSKRYSSNDEWLRFYISNDCGETWALRKNIHGDELSEDQQSPAYFPEDESEWTQVNITNINSTYYTSGFRFKFQFENDNGNNIFIDDINMYAESMAGIIEPQSSVLNLSVYPNPADEQIQLNVNGFEGGHAQISLWNTMGQEVLNLYSGEVNAGDSILDFDVSGVKPGVYFIRLIDGDGQTSVIRFVKS